MTFFAISGLINGILAILLGLLVILNKRRHKIHMLFGIMSLAIAIWSLGYWRWLSAVDHDSALFWARILTFGSTLIPVLHLHWIFSLLGIAKQKKRFLILSYTITALLLFFSFSPLMVSDVETTHGFTFWPKPGILYHFYVLIVYIGMFGYGLWYLLKAYLKTKGRMRYQLKYVFLGLSIAVAGGLTNFPLWYNINIPPYGNPLVISYVLAYAYIIVRYQFMDIFLVMRRSTVYILSMLATIIPAFALFKLNNLFGQLFTSPYAEIIILITSVIIFGQAKKHLSILANKYFFGSMFAHREMLRKLTRKLTTVISLNQLTKELVKSITKNMHVDKTGIIIWDEDRRNYKMHHSHGFQKRNGACSIIQPNYLTQDLEKNKQVIIQEEMFLRAKDENDSKKKQRYEKLAKILKTMGIQMVLPAISKNQLIAMIVLGEKLSRDAYSVEDIRLLQNLSDQAGMAIDNALIHKQVVDFNKVLEKRVKQRTISLEKANIKLKQALRAKSEFLDIASHQLRTPTSIIRGMLSMIINDDLTESEKMDFIEKSFQSANRLTIVISDLLDASEAEDDKIKLNRSPLQLEKLLKESVEFLLPQAKEKKLDLKLELPEKTTKKILGDPERIRGVIDNIIDNSIHYTEKGSILVKLEKNHNYLIISICDTGIGITPKEQKKLFKKFSRGKRASNVHANGSGLGLFIVKKTIKAHHGKIEIKSKGKNKGTCFKVYLPFNI
tara:strand:- start:442 stop:2616 length:2175 start_codon:yes stop_codon:yes gene_type:complete